MKRFLIKIGILPEGELSRKAVIAHARKRGWRWLLIIVAYYAIRDTVLYIILPYLALRGIITGW